MSGNSLYYIYIDTKMPGAIEQLVRYFQAQVFTKSECINVLCKYYKEIEEDFANTFSKNSIPYKFIKRQSDIDLENGKVVFYLFNAQSNCRIVSYRGLTHIFVTHGESHKLASVKPIIRIYDFVITSGMVGIERYLKTGIFTQFDIDDGKVIKLGNTFIGNNSFSYDYNCSNIVYAPTWEGGVPEEDYCSINSLTTQKIIEFCEAEKIKKIYIQQHPNLGHRLHRKKDMLNEMIKAFQEKNLNAILINQKNKKSNFIDRFLRKKTHPSQLIYNVCYALTDISAMEVQFISKGIPCSVFINDGTLNAVSIPKALNSYYKMTFIKPKEKIKKICVTQQMEIRKYFIDYEIGISQSLSYSKRIKWLCEFATKEKERKTDLHFRNY